MAEAGARLAIRLLQDAAERGEIDPWDVDVIAVIDGFLDQLRSRIALPRLVIAPGSRRQGGSYEHDLAETSEAFLAASVLVGLKAELLEASTVLPEPVLEEAFDFDDDGQGWLLTPALELPARPERHLLRRPVAPPPLQRPVTLGELIQQLEEIAERLERVVAGGAAEIEARLEIAHAVGRPELGAGAGGRAGGRAAGGGASRQACRGRCAHRGGGAGRA